MLLRERAPSRIRWRLADFYDAAIDAAMLETTGLARTSRHGGRRSRSRSPKPCPTPASRGFNRVVQQTMRVGCGYRNMINYQRRILSHTVITRPHRSAA